METSARFFRVSLALTCLLTLSLGSQLISPVEAASASNQPFSASPSPPTLNLPLGWPGVTSPSLAALLAPCSTRPSNVNSALANLPPVQPLTPENNPDLSASPPGEVLSGLEATLNGLVQDSLDEGLDAASVIIKDGATGQVIQVYPDQVFSSASLYKIFVLWKVQVEINAGRLSEDSLIPRVVYSDESPSDEAVSEPTTDGTISVGEARRLMITLSDNSAAWSLAWAVGWYNIDAMLTRHNYTVTKLDQDIPVTTAAEVTRFFEELNNQTLDDALSQADYAVMLDLFKDQQINSKLPAGLPDGAIFAHKTGNLDSVTHDAGILYTPDGRAVYITVMTDGNYGAGQDLMERVAEFSWQNLGHKPLPVYFKATQKTVSGRFYQYWLDQGGLASFGYPLNEAQLELNRATGVYYLTQWFERARFEFHPENLGTPYEVLLGLLGSELCQQALQSDPRFKPAKPIDDPDRFIFSPQTGHNLGNGFLGYWQQTGGLSRYGLPISEEHPEINQATGKQYTVQWFERARFEYHPENVGTPYTVLLGLLGREYSGIPVQVSLTDPH